VFKDEKEKLLESCDWKAYTTDDGKEYYHNQKTDTTQWEMPPEYAAHKIKVEQLVKKETPNKMDGDLSLLTKEEKEELFCLALKRAGVTVNMSQDDAFALIKTTKEWTACKISERKAFFNHYISDLKLQEQKEQRRKEQQNAEDFIKMLFECEQITTSTRFRDAMTLVCTNPIYLAVSPNEKEKLFDTFMRRKEDKIAAEEVEKKRVARDAFIQLMLHSSITLDTQWRDFKDEKKDDPVFTDISLSDAIEYFQVYLREVEKLEDARLQTKQKEIISRSRKIRFHYRTLLEEELSKGQITKRSTWSAFRPTIQNDNRFKAMLEPDIEGSTPAEMFYDIVVDLEEKYERDMKRVKEILKDINLSLNPSITIDTFISKIDDHEYYEYVDEANVEPIFHELQEKAARHLEKTKATAKKRFSEILLLCSLTREITWDTLVPHLARPDINFLPLNDEEKSALFQLEMQRRVLEDDFQKIISTEPRREKEIELEKDKDREKDKRGRDRDRDRDDRRKHRDEKDKHDHRDSQREEKDKKISR
jgi:pre-mRNA-processing factor 40